LTTFFEHQRLARRNTRVMVGLFALAVVAVVAAVDLALGAVYWWTNQEPVPDELLVLGAAVTLAVILAASLFSIIRLAAGGTAVARMVGARPVPPDTADPLERRLRNVVEEMAIASGVRVPEVYVMDGEGGINAFAAGWDVSGAVVAVTRGTLQRLTRDELQGVVAHEFSHILNGDMRLNIRMLGVLAGIVFIASIGEFVMRSVRGSRDTKGFFLVGLALFLIGYVGLFFSRLIKSSVARQREFLADASSVQFTRNPEGIAGALDQIQASGAGTLIASRYAEELSHMFFGPSVKVWLAFFATHPPLAERIRRVHPGFQADDYRQKRQVAPPAPAPEAAEALATAVPPAGRRGADIGAAWGRTPEQSVALVGSLDAGKIDYAARLLSFLPQPLREAVREPGGAGAAMVALLLAPGEEALRRQLEALNSAGLGTLAGLARAAYVHTRGLGLEFHLPVIDLGLAALKAAPTPAKQEVVAGMEIAVTADRRVSLHEFVILTLVRDQLAPAGKKVAGNRKISDLKIEASIVLALVAHAGTRVDATGARAAALQAAIRAGSAAMGIPEAAAPALSLESANAALEALKALAPMEKALLVKGLFAAVTLDGTIRVAEAGVMRVVGAVLDCPLPPLLDSPLFEPA
jgi:Zn-dependent protease with chaperone function